MAEITLQESEMNNLHSSLSELLKSDSDPNSVYQRLGRHICQIIKEVAPNTFSELQSGQSALEGRPGFIITKQTGIELVDPSLAQLTAIALSSILGRPTRTDQRKSQIAWPIHFDPTAGENPTFSQTMGEAEYHTDTQYFAEPERYFGLFCVVSDKPGKGTNHLVDGAALRRKIESQDPELVSLLQQDYPFRVPTAFTKNASDDDVEIIWAPILQNDGSVRYRKDTIERAMKLPGISISKEQRESLRIFDKMIAGVEPFEHHLQPGEAIFVNNHNLLHSRTPYDDPRRLLYRVRMEPDNE
jgi:hypothetical protein